jgi:hypothetical protein
MHPPLTPHPPDPARPPSVRPTLLDDHVIVRHPRLCRQRRVAAPVPQAPLLDLDVLVLLQVEVARLGARLAWGVGGVRGAASV